MTNPEWPEGSPVELVDPGPCAEDAEDPLNPEVLAVIDELVKLTGSERPFDVPYEKVNLVREAEPSEIKASFSSELPRTPHVEMLDAQAEMAKVSLPGADERRHVTQPSLAHAVVPPELRGVTVGAVPSRRKHGALIATCLCAVGVGIAVLVLLQGRPTAQEGPAVSAPTASVTPVNGIGGAPPRATTNEVSTAELASSTAALPARTLGQVKKTPVQPKDVTPNPTPAAAQKRPDLGPIVPPPIPPPTLNEHLKPRF